MFENMTLIEGIGDEVFNFFVFLFTIIVVYLAWRSTNVREDRLQRTAVLIIENNRRRLTERVNQHPVTLSILRSSSRQSNASDATEELEISDENTSSPVDDLPSINEPPNLLSVLDEINNLHLDQQQNVATTVSVAEQIIQEMDNLDDVGVGLRRRRFMFNNADPNNSTPTTNSGDGGNDVSQQHQPSDEITIDTESISLENDSETTNADNCENENNENSNMSRIVTESLNPTTTTTANLDVTDTTIPPTKIASDTKDNVKENGSIDENQMRIKLMYLNDDLKLVNGMPNEAVGDFKKRNFSVELAAQKCVRLVFNGHVLQPDTKTLQACGLFDNCVVHCLVHNRKPTPQNQQNQTNTGGNTEQNQIRNLSNGLDGPQNVDNNLGTTNNRGQSRFTDLFVYFGRGLTGLILAYGWYCRFRYNYLFSWFSTIGLVLITALYFGLMMINVFIEIETATG